MQEAVPQVRKIAVVTGGCRNLGRAISCALGEKGYHVIATTRDPGKYRDLGGPCANVEVLGADVSREAGVERTFERVIGTGLPLGILVNNASSFPRGPLLSLSTEEVQGAFESTVLSSFMCSTRAVPLMRASGWGRIINIGMMGADIVRGYGEVAAHASAKTALAVLTLSMARELEGTGITVNMVNPAPIDREGMAPDERARLRGISRTDRLPVDMDVVKRVLGTIEGYVNGSFLTVP